MRSDRRRRLQHWKAHITAYRTGTQADNGAADGADNVSAFAREEAHGVWESLSMFEGKMLFEAVGDEVNQLRMEGRADVAAALESVVQTVRERDRGKQKPPPAVTQVTEGIRLQRLRMGAWWRLLMLTF